MTDGANSYSEMSQLLNRLMVLCGDLECRNSQEKDNVDGCFVGEPLKVSPASNLFSSSSSGNFPWQEYDPEEKPRGALSVHLNSYEKSILQYAKNIDFLSHAKRLRIIVRAVALQMAHEFEESNSGGE